jgi:hypothetical protein
MDPRDRLRDSLAGAGCTACGSAVPAERIDVLAEREDLAFVQFRCPACTSESLGLVVRDADAAAGATADTERCGEFGPADELRLTGPAIDGDDVQRMHRFLEGYRGDLRTLLDAPGADPAGTGGPGATG